MIQPNNCINDNAMLCKAGKVQPAPSKLVLCLAYPVIPYKSIQKQATCSSCFSTVYSKCTQLLSTKICEKKRRVFHGLGQSTTEETLGGRKCELSLQWGRKNQRMKRSILQELSAVCTYTGTSKIFLILEDGKSKEATYKHKQIGS